MSLTACGGQAGTTAAEKAAERGAVSADSVMAYARRQCDFGPRVPGSEAHALCGEWLVAELQRLGADTVAVMGQEETLWDGTRLPVKNIYARFGTGKPLRLLLMAHYDTRPWADQESDPGRAARPIDGANDGASGVAVILEVLRNLKADPAAAGVDVLLTDLEDWGARQGAQLAGEQDTWCVGSRQFAASMPYSAADAPRYGILLDMVGAPGARFTQEYYSQAHAPRATARVWGTAARLGLGDRFPARLEGAVTDDHLPLISAGIPVTDIIECANGATGSFPPTWHTLDDNIDNLDPATMADVARVVLNTIYTEK